MNLLKFYFDPRGYVTRKQYWLLYGVVIFLILIASYGVAIYYFASSAEGDELRPQTAEQLQLFLDVIFFVFYYITIVAHAKRLRDAGYSLWWLVSFITPITGFLIAGSISAFAKTKNTYKEDISTEVKDER